MDETRRLERFAERLDGLGPEFERWPATDAGEAYALIARSAQARALHADARRLAGLVAEAAQADAPNGFAFRVVSDIEARNADRLGWLVGSPRRFALAGGSVCAAALALGVLLGSIAAPAQADDADPDLGSPLVSIEDAEL